MAYDVTEERLKVRGSEQITRDLKVNRDTFINGATDTKNLIVEDDATVKGEAIFEDDVAIHGDLYVEGTTTTTSEAQVSSSGNYVVTRDNNATPLANGEYSGLAVNNYATGKIATITADKDGTWRISDSATATATTYTNISAYNGVYYTGLSQTITTGPSGILTNVDADELASVVKNGSSYYHKAGNDWFGPVTLVNNALDIGSIVTDATLITTLNGLTKHDLVYYRSVIDKTIDASTNQPLLTRAEASDLTGGQALTWDATNEKAVGKTIDTTVTSGSSSLITSGAVKTAVDTAEANAKNLANATGTLAIAHGGTGQTTAQAIVDETIQAGIGDATGDVMDTTSIITTNNAGYSTADKRLYRRPATALWTYIKSKLNSIFGLGATKTDNAIARWDGTDGKLQNSGITINDDNTIVFPTVSGAGGRTLIQQSVGGNDMFRIYAGATASDSGYGEIATSDNGNEPIYVKQYSGPFSEPTSVRTATLLDASGNTSFPGTVSASFSGNLSGNATTATRANNAYSINGSYACNTAAATAAKTVALPGFILTKGSKFIINVTNANTAASALTLNVNDTGAKPIRVDGNVTSATVHSLPAGLYNCYYDGTYWNMDSSYESLNARNANWATSADYTRGNAYCTTAAATAAKEASMRGFTLATGATFPITFGISNTAVSALTLNVNSTGAKPIYLGGSASSSTNYTLPAGTYLCKYNGTNFYIDKTYAVPDARFAYSSERAYNANSISGSVICSTAAATAAKTVSWTGFTLVKGSKLIVNLSNANTAASALTLNVNNTGAKTIRWNGTVTSASAYAMPAGLYNCYYDGTYWNMDSACEAYNARNAVYATAADYTRGNAYCTTAAGTAAKTASMVGYVLQSGTTFPISFSNSNTAASALTLNINSKGAKPIYINGAASSSSNHTLPAGTYLCTYDGTNYLIDTAGSNVSTKMNMANPTGTGSFSLNRQSNTIIGAYSSTLGHNATASGFCAHAEGSQTAATGDYSHAEGISGGAQGMVSHTEGMGVIATGVASHAEGLNTEASGNYQHVQGKYNVVSDTWAFVIGGGTDDTASARKNILAFDWNGNLHIFGDIYVHCNNDGTGGTKK